LSDDDADDLEILEVAAGAAAAPKRKLSETGISKADEGGSKAKKVKVAPLFERTKGLPAVKREEGTSAGAARSAGVQDSLNRLQQWKFSATPAVAKAASPSESQTNGLPSSSPLPEVPGVSKADKALEAQRAQVRKRLLGHETSWQRHTEDEARSPPATEPNSASEEDEDEAPVASTSKAKGKGKGRVSDQDKENIPPAASSRFASFASAGKDAKDGTAKGKGKKTDAKGKGKAKEAETGVKYTPLEQQVMDIKKRNVGTVAIQVRRVPNLTLFTGTQPDVLLIVEVGYKFKFFGDDAKIASKELNIGKLSQQTARLMRH
jgi:DNA mismatch repair protein MSH3